VTVVNEFDEGYYASLAFDPSNRPMIAHYDETNDNLRFSVREAGIGWLTATVDAAGSTGLFPSIAIDPDNGLPAIAYFDDSTDDLRYAAWNGDMWNLTTVDAAGSVGLHPSLAFDPRDDLPANPTEGSSPAIAYLDATNTNLKLAWFDAVTMLWDPPQTVDAVGDVGFTPSLAFNRAGILDPSIAYFDNGAAGTGHLFFIDDPPITGPGGDYNGDGVADAADYVAWRKLYADGPGSGGAASGGSAIPEPAAIMLLGLALIGGSLCPRSRSS
jgi:hypothetical protein